MWDLDGFFLVPSSEVFIDKLDTPTRLHGDGKQERKREAVR